MSNIIALLKKFDQPGENHLLSFFVLRYVSLHTLIDKQKSDIDCFVILAALKIVPSLPGII